MPPVSLVCLDVCASSHPSGFACLFVKASGKEGRPGLQDTEFVSAFGLVPVITVSHHRHPPPRPAKNCLLGSITSSSNSLGAGYKSSEIFEFR